MKDGSLKPAYNVRSAVNSKYITGMEWKHNSKYSKVTADAGYMRFWTIICIWNKTENSVS